MRALKTSLPLILFAISFQMAAQYTGNEKKYTVAGITVSGAVRYTPQTILNYTDLRSGISIIVPGDKIRNAIAKLWDSGLFKNVDIYATKIKGDKIWLEISLSALSQISRIEIRGAKQSQRSDIIEENDLKIGDHITEDLLLRTRSKIRNTYREKGYYNAEVSVTTQPDTVQNGEVLLIDIDRGNRVKIKRIHLRGNAQLRTGKLKAAMKGTKEKAFWHIFSPSRFREKRFEEDLQKIVDTYKHYGFRDAHITRDSVHFAGDNAIIDIEVYEGKKYYFGDIKWIGNTAYPTTLLNRVLGYEKGDPYDVVGLGYKLNGNPKKNSTNDVRSLYLNNGYLFSYVYPVETSVNGDLVNVEIHIHEDDPAHINRVEISGNKQTHDHVIYRELRSKPGDLFSKEKLQRSAREISQLGLFDPQKISIEPIPNPDRTVDILMKLEEKGSSQVELQGGYGGGRFVGGLGFSLINFSSRNLFNGKAWRPVPMGDGEKLSLHLQVGNTYKSYSFSFTEPWLGGVKPNSLIISLYRNEEETRSPSSTLSSQIDEGSIKTTGFSVGLAKRLAWPDDYFTLEQNLSFERYDIQRCYLNAFKFNSGHSNNVSYQVIFGRNASGPNPIYPIRGSNFNLSLKATPPYSLLGLNDFKKYKKKMDEIEAKPHATQQQKTEAEQTYNRARFQWLEFYKVEFKGDWYTRIAKDLVLRFNTGFGTLGAYNSKREVSPFERFYMGGTGMNSWYFDNRENVALRGYPDPDTYYDYQNPGTQGEDITPVDGGVLYDKFSLELRYPLTLNPRASVYVLGFAEGGSIADQFDNWYPFKLKRSAGLGIRIFMNPFGLLGIDFGYGFDPFIGQTKPSGWQTHFIFNRQF